MIYRLPIFKNSVLFFLTLIVFQVLFIFQGLDYGDTGTYATLYAQIFRNPESQQFMFNYWLTAIIGGLWLEVFPGMGLLGLRLFGIIVTTGSLILVYVFLKDHVKDFSLKTGIIIGLIIQMANLQTEMYYNKLSVFFWIAASLLLFTGLRKDRIWLLAFSGAIAGFNIFVRLPNILGISMALVIFYYGWLNKERFRIQFGRLLVFAAGLFISILLIGLIMKLLGHLNIFVEGLQITSKMGNDPEDAHNLSRITALILRQFRGALSLGSIFFILTFFSVILISGCRRERNYVIAKKLIILTVGLIIGALTILGILTSNNLDFFLIGMVLISGIFIVVLDAYNSEFKTLVFLGLIFVVLFPVGSASGLSLPGKYGLLLILPLAIQVIIDLGSIDISFKDTISKAQRFYISAHRLKLIPDLFLVIILTMGLIVPFTSPYMEDSSRFKLVYTVGDDKLKGIYTSEKKATELKELLEASSEHIYPGMTVFAFPDIPLYQYLSETVPYLNNPWPGQYTPSMLKAALNVAINSQKKLPLIVLNKHIPSHVSLREGETMTNYYYDRNMKVHKIMKDFIDSNGYSVIWESDIFLIMDVR